MLLDTYVLIALATRSHEDHQVVRAFIEGRQNLVVSAISYVEFMGWPEARPFDLALRDRSTRS